MSREKSESRTGMEIAVIGMAGRFPGAQNIAEFWENLKNGVESISFISDQELQEANVEKELINNPNYVNVCITLDGKDKFDASFFGYTPVEAELMNPQIRIFHECAWEALEDAGYNPYSYKGKIGLYAGASNGFYWQAISLLSGKSAEFGEFAASQLIDKDYLCSRVSYNFNLKGASSFVQTTCSTSLVAIHQACRALLTAESQVVLAGGASISSTPRQGYLYQEGMILSLDGHCRTFDARANGTIQGEGVGIVVLKRLKLALEDKDHIYAVIKGTAINNDGSRKVGFTAPCVEAQAEAIRAALRMARVEPETVTYIEAHGTATNLGDPVEIEALKLAFNTGKRNYCGIGSVKSNFGHLDAAAGVAGFIKTVLALTHQLIPPSLHFENPNNTIDFGNSPFYVNRELSPWENKNHPLRAGVSSFGIGGTNAHVVLEEAPPPVIGEAGREPGWPYQLILLSAKTEPALDKITGNLAEYLKKNPHINLADAAYTLQIGRRNLPYRKMLVCGDVIEAVEALISPGPGKVNTFLARAEEPQVVFMFPGQGSQYVNMGLELYQTESLFRHEMDRCFEILVSIMNYDLKEILYPEDSVSEVCSYDSARPPGTGDSPLERGTPDPRKGGGVFNINQTEIAQPLLFVFEFSLAKLLMKWGIKPFAMIGHSIGEYVAACLSEVFSLEEALKIVALRGKLMQQVPPGTMLSIPLSEEQLTPLLEHNISLAAVNSSFHCVVSGSYQAMEKFKKKLKTMGQNSTHLHTSHAYHSSMMEPVLEDFEKALKQTGLRKPEIPYISNLTGDWITGQDTTDTSYWSRHLRETVRFASGLEKLLKEEEAIFFEIGPGKSLSTFVRQHKNKKDRQPAVNLVRHPKENIPDCYYLLDKIGKLWLYGKSIDWNEFYSGEKRQRIPLPGYPFQGQRYWIDADPYKIHQQLSSGDSRFDKHPGNEDWFYIPSWTRTLFPTSENGNLQEQKQWLVFDGGYRVGEMLTQRLKQAGKSVITVSVGEEFAKIQDQEYSINPWQADNYKRLLDELDRLGHDFNKVVHCWGVQQTNDRQGQVHKEIVRRHQVLGFYSILHLAKAIGKRKRQGDVEISVITNDMQEVTGQEVLCPGKSTVLGLIKVIPQEQPNIACRSIDLVLPTPGSWQEKKMMDQLENELFTKPLDTVVALRGNNRLIRAYEPIKLDDPPQKRLPLREKGVYLVTGGLGNIGLILAEYLVKCVRARLILTGRSVFPPKEEWENHLAAKGEKDPVSQKIIKLQELENQGGKVLTATADVADQNQMQEVIRQAEEVFGPLNGVIHGAGVIRGRSINVIREISQARCEEQFHPKIYGLLTLASVLKDRTLDFCWLLSSLSSVLGGLQFAAYSAANIFMDAFVSWHNQGNPQRWSSILWEGMSANETARAFKRIFALKEVDHLVVSWKEHLKERMAKWINRETLLEQEIEHQERPSVGVLPRPNLMNPYRAPQNSLQEEVANIWQKLFGFEKIGIDDDFFELGGDSLRGITVISKIHQKLNVEIPLLEFFTRPTIGSLAEYIKRKEKCDYSPITLAEKKEYYPLSSAQKRIYFLQQLDLDSTVYNLPGIYVSKEELDKERLEKTFIKLIARHENLRNSFHMLEDIPVQKIHDEAKFELEHYDISKLEEKVDSREGTTGYIVPGGNTEESSENRIKNFIRPFDLSQPPMLRVGFIKVEKKLHIMMVDMHHIISDGVSHLVLVENFAGFYLGQKLPGLMLQYKDFSEWQNSEKQKGALSRQREYWLKQFEGEIPVLNIPRDYPRPAMQTFVGSSVTFKIGPEETGALNQLAKKERITLYMVLLAVFNILLAKISNQNDIVIGTPAAGRRHADLENIIGMFVNTLALRNRMQSQESFIGFLQRVKENTLNAFENQEYQFEDLVDELAVNRDVSRNPLFDVMFVSLDMGAPRVEIPDLNLTPYEYENRTAKFDLTLWLSEDETLLSFVFEYCKKLFKQETIKRFISFYKKIIYSILNDPDKKISQLEIIPGEEKRQIVFDFNNTNAEYPRDKTIHELFEEQVERRPDQTALPGQIPKGVSVHVTYKELNDKSRQLARLLKEKGVLANNIVGIMMDRSIEMVIGILGILKAGGAYLPIDPDYPQDRIQYMLKDSSAKILLTGQEISEYSPPQASKIRPKGTSSFGIWNFEFGISPRQGGQLAYILYTSGSTGKPKGVMVEHRSVINTISALDEMYPFEESDVYLFKTSYTFDVSVTELFGWFFSGGALAVLKKHGEKDPYEILTAIEIFGVTHINFVPSMFNVFVNTLNQVNIGKLSSLKYIFLAGEALLPDPVRKFRVFNSEVVLENIYGPTEATIYASGYSLSNWDSSGNIPIGKPLPNVQLYVFDRFGHLQPIGIVGELCISGAGVARGYLNRPTLTAERFLPDFYSSYRSYMSYMSYIYKTGDLAKWLPDGNIEFLGRIDHQVKIRGNRIELGEIECQLLQHPEVKEAVVLAKEDEMGDGDRYLAAYIVSECDVSVLVSELRKYLSKILPDYMMPSYFVQLDNIPLTPNGKVDRKALPAPGIETGEHYKAPRDEIEKKLVDLWSDILKVEKEKISIDANFFHLGGHSLKAAVLTARIHKELDINVPLTEIFKTPHIRGLATYIKEAARSKHIPLEPVEKKKYYPLSSAQRRLYFIQQMDVEKGIAYNIPSVWQLEGNLDAEKLAGIFHQLIRRHESLRTFFTIVNDEPVQRISVFNDLVFEIECYHISTEAPEVIKRKRGKVEAAVKAFNRPFDLTKAPLLRARLFNVDNQNHLLMVYMHHIITDGTSMDLFVNEFMASYAGKELSPLKFQYKDYTQWQNSKVQKKAYKEQEKYWLKQFANDIPVLKLTLDFPRPVVQSFEGDRVNFELDINETKALNDLASKENITLYMLMLALFNVFLSKLSGQEDIIIGTDVASRRHTDFEHIIGMFVNTLVLRNYPRRDQSFKEFLQEVKTRALDAIENQDYQFDDLVHQVVRNRDENRNPMFDVMFSFQEIERGVLKISGNGNPELKTKPYELKHGIARFDLTLTIIKLAGNLYLSFEYCTKLFKEVTIKRFISYFKEITKSILENPDMKIREIEMVSDEEEKQFFKAISLEADEMFIKNEESHELADTTEAEFDFDG